MSNPDIVFKPDTTVPDASTGIGKPEPSFLASFTGGIAPSPVSAAYTIGLAVVALGMLLLAAAYICMIGLAVYAGWYHLSHNFGLLSEPGGAGAP